MGHQSALSFDDDKILEDIKKDIQNKRSLIDKEALKKYDNMKIISRGDLRARMADMLVNRLSARLSETWPRLYECLSLIKKYEIYKQPDWLSDGDTKPFETFKDYFQSRVGHPFEAFVELEETYKFAQEYNDKWFDKPFEEAAALTRAEKAAQTAMAVSTSIAEARKAGVEKTQAEIAERVAELTGVEITQQAVSKIIKCNPTTEMFTANTSVVRPTKGQEAKANGRGRTHQHYLDTISKHPDLRSAIDPQAPDHISISKAYALAREREGKPIDNVTPLQRKFSGLTQAEQERFCAWAMQQLGWETGS